LKVAIIYNLIETLERGFEKDMLAEEEILKVMRGVKMALVSSGHSVKSFQATPSLFASGQLKGFDMVFNLAESFGTNVAGEPYIPAALEMMGLPFTGSGAETLAICLDKVRTKQIFISAGITTPRFWVFKKVPTRSRKYPYPLIVKPTKEDASIGISTDSVVHNQKDLKKKIAFIIKNYKQPALVEEYIDGREINVAILGNGNHLKVLPVSEIIFDLPEGLPRIVSFEAKWIEDHVMYKGTVRKCPADLSKKESELIRRMATTAYRLMKCNDYARIDIRLANGIPYVLEVNPNPDISYQDSGFAVAARRAGKKYPDLIRQIVTNAIRRHNASRKGY